MRYLRYLVLVSSELTLYFVPGSLLLYFFTKNNIRTVGHCVKLISKSTADIITPQLTSNINICPHLPHWLTLKSVVSQAIK